MRTLSSNPISNRTAFAALTIVMSFSGGGAWAIDDNSCNAESDVKALDVLRAKVRSERLYSTRARERCLSFYPEQCDDNVVEVAIRELHTVECGGDPSTGPIVDRFRVFKQSSRIEWFANVVAEYFEFDKVDSRDQR